jgi:hypothetical protein
MAKVAAAYGKPLQPWQRRVVDVATEVLRMAAGPTRTVVVHVQRQAGKTTLVLAPVAAPLPDPERAKTWLTAQSRQDARDTWRDCAELVAGSPLSPLLEVRAATAARR